MYLQIPKNYDPVTRKYQHVCPVCQQKFWGRKNKIYHDACKVWHGNEKASEIRNLLKEGDAKRKSNLKALRLMSLLGYTDRSLHLVILEKAGFDLDFMERKQMDERGQVLYTLGPFQMMVYGKGDNRKVWIMEGEFEENAVLYDEYDQD